MSSQLFFHDLEDKILYTMPISKRERSYHDARGCTKRHVMFLVCLYLDGYLY